MAAPVKRPWAIVFDLDGTLIDSAPDLQAAINGVLAAQGRGALGLVQVRHMIGDGAAKLVERACRATGAPPAPAQREEMVQRFLEHYRAEPMRRTRLYPGVLPVLARLRGANHPLGICSNKPHQAALELLQGLGLAPLFDALLGSGATPRHKPHPSHLLATVAALGGDPRRSLMVGDAEPDAEAAQRADMPLVLVTYGYAKTPHDQLPAAARIGSFEQLPAAITHITRHSH